MVDDEQGVTRALASRETVIEIISVAVVLAVSINLITSYMAERLGADSLGTLILGTLFFLIPLIHLIKNIRNSLKTTTEIDGVVAFDIRQKELVDIPGYNFSEKLGKTTKAAFFENPAFQKMWDDNPLIPPQQHQHESPHSRIDDAVVVYSAIYVDGPSMFSHSPSSKLLTEACEYYVIELLSDHLANYFQNRDAGGQSITELTGSDIPQILLSNRFLKLLTTPFEERPIYTQASIPAQAPNGGKLKYIQGSDGSIFSTLSLWLPRNTQVTRSDQGPGSLELNGKKACIRFSIAYSQERIAAPTHFIEMYLGKMPSNIALLKVKVTVDVKVKATALLSPNGWRLYRWADTLPAKMRKSIDFNAFIERVNWEQIKTQARVSKILKRIEDNMERRASN
ncbi:hypothetical protein [Massilia sp. DD77]|uniref:hypothetical protein n=1 Tax=Massilia sp. DD77 TaxID=3109349 RepID=UPI002FFE6D51